VIVLGALGRHIRIWLYQLAPIPERRREVIPSLSQTNNMPHQPAAFSAAFSIGVKMQKSNEKPHLTLAPNPAPEDQDLPKPSITSSRGYYQIPFDLDSVMDDGDSDLA